MKNDKEESLLNALPLNDYAKAYNWIIPVMVLIIITLGLYLSIKDIHFLNISNIYIVEKLMNKN